jgi:hypothetical protein
MPRVPTPLKVYGESVLGGKQGEITNADFTPDELAAVRQLTVAAGAPNPRKGAKGVTLPATPGAVTYDTYRKQSADVPAQQWSNTLPNSMQADVGPLGLISPQGRVANTLGQFNYEMDPNGVLHVRDRYNFNPHYGNLDTATKVVANIGSFPFAQMHWLGEKAVPEGTGRRVHLQYPPLSPP